MAYYIIWSLCGLCLWFVYHTFNEILKTKQTSPEENWKKHPDYFYLQSTRLNLKNSEKITDEVLIKKLATVMYISFILIFSFISLITYGIDLIWKN